MKMLNSILMFSIMLLLGACGENRSGEAEEEAMVAETQYQDADEAMAEWKQAWDSNDPLQIMSRTADDVVLVLNGSEVPQDSIRSFLQESGSAMRDLQMNSLEKNSTDRLAYDTGTFSHGYNNDTVTYNGSYTFIWERIENEPTWLVKVMNISGVHPEMPENQ